MSVLVKSLKADKIRSLDQSITLFGNQFFAKAYAAWRALKMDRSLAVGRSYVASEDDHKRNVSQPSY